MTTTATVVVCLTPPGWSDPRHRIRLTTDHPDPVRRALRSGYAFAKRSGATRLVARRAAVGNLFLYHGGVVSTDGVWS